MASDGVPLGPSVRSSWGLTAHQRGPLQPDGKHHDGCLGRAAMEKATTVCVCANPGICDRICSTVLFLTRRHARRITCRRSGALPVLVCMHCAASAKALAAKSGCVQSHEGSIIQSAAHSNSLIYIADAVAMQAVPQDHTVAQAFMGETVAAFILMFVVCMVGLDKKGNPNKMPAVMALTIPALIYVLGPVSSMCINPARAFGPALVSGFWEHHWLWWTAPFLGGLLAVVPYKYMTDLEDEDTQA